MRAKKCLVHVMMDEFANLEKNKKPDMKTLIFADGVLM
jgi:hypothetical protein